MALDEPKDEIFAEKKDIVVSVSNFKEENQTVEINRKIPTEYLGYKKSADEKLYRYFAINSKTCFDK